MSRLTARIRAALHRFAAGEEGSATVEWVVGTAAGVSLALVVMDGVSAGVEALATRIETTLASIDLPPPPQQ